MLPWRPVPLAINLIPFPIGAVNGHRSLDIVFRAEISSIELKRLFMGFCFHLVRLAVRMLMVPGSEGDIVGDSREHNKSRTNA